MPKRIAAAAALVLTIGLASCAADVTAGSGQPDASEPRPQTSQQVEESPAPLVAETPETDASADVEAAFIEKFHEIRATMPGESQIPNATDAQLITAGWEGCERAESGESTELMSFIEGEVKNGAGYYSDSGAIITAARQTLCPAD